MKIRQFSLEGKLFLYILYANILLSVIWIIGNITIGFPFVYNYKWFALIVITLIALKFVYADKYVKQLQVIIFASMLFIILPVGWITSGGSNNFTIVYVFLFIIPVNYLFYGKTRIFFVSSTIGVLIALLLLEKRYPAIIFPYDSTQHFRDLLIQMPLTLIAGSLMLMLFVDEYRKERKKLAEYSELLHQKNKELEEISIKDELTSLFNRRYLFTKLEEAKKNKESLSLIIIDIDNFKGVNDRYGHLAGDIVIKKVSKLLTDVIGENGIVGRLGGDEFLILLNTTNLTDTRHVAQEIIEGATRLDFAPVPTVSVSGGAALFTPEKEISEAIASADEVLYEVKSSGKGDIVVK